MYGTVKKTQMIGKQEWNTGDTGIILILIQDPSAKLGISNCLSPESTKTEHKQLDVGWLSPWYAWKLLELQHVSISFCPPWWKTTSSWLGLLTCRVFDCWEYLVPTESCWQDAQWQVGIRLSDLSLLLSCHCQSQSLLLESSQSHADLSYLKQLRIRSFEHTRFKCELLDIPVHHACSFMHSCSVSWHLWPVTKYPKANKLLCHSLSNSASSCLSMAGALVLSTRTLECL